MLNCFISPDGEIIESVYYGHDQTAIIYGLEQDSMYNLGYVKISNGQLIFSRINQTQINILYKFLEKKILLYYHSKSITLENFNKFLEIISEEMKIE